MEKNIFLSLHILSHSPLRDARQKVKAGNWKQELKEKPWMNATIGLFIHDLISLLSYTYRLLHLTKAWHLSQWIGPFHIYPKPRKFPQDSRTEAFSGLHTLFSDNYSFCQIEGKKTARADWKYLSPCNKKLWMIITKLLKATMFLHM